MTLTEMIFELFDQLGSDTRFDPSGGLGSRVLVNTSEGAKALAAKLDWAQEGVSSWKDARVRGYDAFSWTGSFKEQAIKVEPYHFTGLTVSGLYGALYDLNVSGELVPSYNLEGSLLAWNDVSGQEQLREIMVHNLTSRVLTGFPVFTNNSTGLAVKIYPRKVRFPDSSRIKSFHKVYLLDSNGGQKELSKVERGELLVNLPVEKGEPSRWWFRGRDLYFDKAFEEELYLKVVVEASPPSINQLVDTGGGILGLDLSVECELPSQFHYALVLYALGFGFGLTQDLDMQQAARNNFEAYMRSTVDQGYTMNMLDQGTGPSFGL